MNAQQIEVVTSITALTLACRDQTGIRIYHEVQAWPDAHTWSTVRAMDEESAPLLESIVDVREDGVEERVRGAHHVNTLAQQRDELACWIAAHRKEKAA